MAEFTTSITITLPDGVSATDFRDAVAREYHYPEYLPDGETPNPESKTAHIKRITCDGYINAYEADLVKQAAQAKRDENASARDDFVVA